MLSRLLCHKNEVTNCKIDRTNVRHLVMSSDGFLTASSSICGDITVHRIQSSHDLIYLCDLLCFDEVYGLNLLWTICGQ